jgi:hypothetical protein
MGKLRRRLVVASTGALALLGPKSLSAQPISLSDSGAGPDYSSNELSGVGFEGTDPALNDERQSAAKLLAGIASICKTPLQFFEAFDALSRPDATGTIPKNRDGELYNEGWRTRWNPVIVRFFQETRTQPSGDETAWCAASVNWCLARSGLRTTRSASSGSFRNSDGSIDSVICQMIDEATTTAPKPGDVAVFRSADLDAARLGRGHVALFLEETPNKVYVIGGNQLTASGHHGFSKAWFPKAGKQLVLDSYKSIDKFVA